METNNDQSYLDEVFDRAVRLVEDGITPQLEALIVGHADLRDEVERLIRLAQQVAIGPRARFPVLSGYRLLQELGQGGMGTVYLARQESLGGRPVALKVLPSSVGLSPRARTRFLREARAVAKLRHPNIVAVHDVVQRDQVCAYAMEWVEGTSLASLIDALAVAATRGGTRTGNRSGPSMDEVRAALGDTAGEIRDGSVVVFMTRVGLAIARALAAVHDAGLLHRDVKPSNILLRRDGTPLLADFGLAKDTPVSTTGSDASAGSTDEARDAPESPSDHDIRPTLTLLGHFAGTVTYAAPEQLRGDTAALDARSDVYALGVTLYHALALRPPFDAREPSAMLRTIESGAAPLLRRMVPRIPRDLETIVAKAMETDPARRYASARDLADDLERLLNFQPIRAKPAGWLSRGRKLVRRHRGAAVGLTLGGLMAMGLAALLVTWFFFVPGWKAEHVRDARLILLDPDQSNHIVSVLYWGRFRRMDSHAWAARRKEYDRALSAYDEALRLSPFDDALRHERAIVQAARDGTDQPGDDARSAGLFAFLTQDYDGALAAWAKYDQARNVLKESDPVVDAAIGVLYLFDDQAARAYPRLQHAVEGFPGVRFLLEYLADAAVKCGDLDRAERWLGESRLMGDEEPFGARKRIEAQLLAARGRTDEAIAALQPIRYLGVNGIELARLLERAGRMEAAVDARCAAAEQFPESLRVQKAFVDCADRWWASLSAGTRMARIEAELDSPTGPLPAQVQRGLRPVLMQYQRSRAALRAAGRPSHRSNVNSDRGATPRPVVKAAQAGEVPRSQDGTGGPVLGVAHPGFAARVLVSTLGFFAALPASISSPSLQSRSLGELAERMEVDDMALWSRITRYPKVFRGVSFAAWRWPMLRSVMRSIMSIFVAMDEAHQRRLQRSRLAAFSAAILAAGVASQPAHGQCDTPPCFQGLGDLPGGNTESYAYGISADGTTVVGVGKSAASGGFFEGFRWRAATGMTGLGDLPGNLYMSQANGVSADGSVIVGYSSSGNGTRAEANYQEAFKWTEGGGMVGLGDTPGGFFCSAAYCVSSNGDVIGGQTHPETFFERATLWTTGSGWGPTLDSTFGRYSRIYNMTPDGQWAVGVLDNPFEAVRWSASTGFQILGDLPGGVTQALAYGVSNGGTIVVGYGATAAGFEAFRWTETGGMVSLGDLAGGTTESVAYEILPDGTLIVGDGRSALGQEAAIWDESLVIHRLADVLAENGVTIPPGWTLTSARDITRNGDVVSICGGGTNPQGDTEAWVARYSMASPCEGAQVTQSPASIQVASGGNVTLTVVAGGTGPFTYEWRKNGAHLNNGASGCSSVVAGADTASLSLTNVSSTDAASYDCIVTNACGNATSSPATVTVATGSACQGDLNNDGQVNGNDIAGFVQKLLNG